MTITKEDIDSIATSVWHTLVRPELAATPDSGSSETPLQASHIGIIRLKGSFEGWVSVHLTESMVHDAAAMIFQLSVGELEPEHCLDTVAELTNIIGGNVKCLVEQPTQLAFPEVVSPEELPHRLAENMERTSLELSNSVGRLRVAVHQAMKPVIDSEP